MKKGVVFFGLGIIITALFTFLLRLINAPFFQDKLKLMILVGIIGAVMIIVGLIMKMKKVLIFGGLGVLATTIVNWLVRLIGLNDNVTLLIIFMVVGLVVLIYGIAKK